MQNMSAPSRALAASARYQIQRGSGTNEDSLHGPRDTHHDKQLLFRDEPGKTPGIYFVMKLMQGGIFNYELIVTHISLLLLCYSNLM